MRASEVFTPNKFPEVTFVAEHLEERARHLEDALETGAAVISLSGPSKSGKTVFIEKNIGKDRLIQVPGAGVDHPSKLWDRVFELIGTPTSRRTTKISGFQGSFGGKVGAQAELFVSAQGELTAEGAWSRSTANEHEVPIDDLQLVIRELGGSEFVVFIDDFHYMPREIQRQVSEQIKEAVRSEVLFVVASVPYHSDDAVRANPDLQGRMVKLDFDYWRPNELSRIGTLGFEALNIDPSPEYLAALAREAAGSPQLMQSLCLNTCFELGVRERSHKLISIGSAEELFQRACSRTALTADYSSTVDKMKDGPRTRGQDRKSHLLYDGTVADVYPIIMQAIALDPPELTLRYPNLLGRIQTICRGDAPSGSSVTGACNHIAAIANDSDNRNIVEWDGDNDVLDIRDPYLLFFLRWGGAVPASPTMQTGSTEP